MEQEKLTQHEDLQRAGRTAADALRGYGYEGFAQEYERVLHRFSPDSKEVLAHSRIASTTLKELNHLAEERLAGNSKGKNPALERNVEVQQQLAARLHPQIAPGVGKEKPLDALSFPGKLFLEKHSKPLEHAAQEVRNYLHEKQASMQPTTDKSPLQQSLENQLASYRALPTAYNMEQLETHTRKGLNIMQQDYQAVQRVTQQANERYVAERDFLSAHGRALILSEAEKGEFEMPNRQKGASVAERIDRVAQQLAQYTEVRSKITVIDQESPKVVQQGLRNSTQEIPSEGLEKAGTSFTHLSDEQQGRYAELMTQPLVQNPTKQSEVER